MPLSSTERAIIDALLDQKFGSFYIYFYNKKHDKQKTLFLYCIYRVSILNEQKTLISVSIETEVRVGNAISIVISDLMELELEAPLHPYVSRFLDQGSYFKVSPGIWILNCLKKL